MSFTENPLSHVLRANKVELQRVVEPKDSGTLLQINCPLVTGRCIFQATKAQADSLGMAQLG